VYTLRCDAISATQRDSRVPRSVSRRAGSARIAASLSRAAFLCVNPMHTLMRPNSRSLAVAALAILIAAAALLARWDHINASPFDFAEARQVHYETLTRGYYVLDFGGGPDWQKRVMRARLRDSPPPEVPILPYATAIIYRLAGGEHLWIPRLLSSVFWIVGALLLYLLTTRFTRPWAALIAIAFYLFLPFPFVASTSFQPDPLMVMLIIASILAIVRHHEQPTRQRFFVALVASATAVFIKLGIGAFLSYQHSQLLRSCDQAHGALFCDRVSTYFLL
jgi:4-amino-4-deoxy-L-arabinose transferase-like glycosyltransferase